MQLEVHRRVGAKNDLPGILCVHSAWHASWSWEEKFFREFPQFALISFSLRGHGASAGREHLARWRLSDYVADVIQVAQDIEASTGLTPIIMGHSMGAIIVLKYLETQPAPAVVMLSAPPPHGAMLAAGQFALHYPRAMLDMGKNMLRRPFHGLPPLLPEGLFTPELPLAERTRYLSLLQPESVLAYADIFALDMPKIHQYTMPMLFLQGTTDPFLTRDSLATNVRRFGATQQLVVGNHDLMLDVGASSVAHTIEQWLLANLSAGESLIK